MGLFFGKEKMGSKKITFRSRARQHRTRRFHTADMLQVIARGFEENFLSLMWELRDRPRARANALAEYGAACIRFHQKARHAYRENLKRCQLAPENVWIVEGPKPENGAAA